MLKPVHCMCSMGDDGSPMILCAECKIWYHFTCVDISEPEAEEIGIYICPSCTETSGRRTTCESNYIPFLTVVGQKFIFCVTFA